MTGRFRPRVLLLWWTVVVAVVASVLTFAVIRAGRPDLQVSAQQHQMIDELESVLLHDSVVPQYARVVNQYDTRGFVAGIGDFSTSDGGVLDVIRAYSARVGDNELSRGYEAALVGLSTVHSGDTAGLVGFPDAWRRAAADSVFRAAQTDVLQARDYQPAFTRAQDLGLSSALGVAIIYDSMLQHGPASGPDGLPALIDRTNARMGGTPGSVDETAWLSAFLDERRSVLMSPSEPDHRAVWPLTTGRLDALAGLLRAGRTNLAPPLTVNPYGAAHVIDAGDDDLSDAPPPTGSAPAPPTTRGVVTNPPAIGSPTTAPPRSNPPTNPPATAASTPPASRPPAPPAPVTPRAGLVVRLVSVVSGKAFGVAGGSFEDGAGIVQGGSGPAQQWTLTLSAAGCFNLINVRTGKALDDPDGGNTWGQPMQQWSAGPPGNANQSWCFDPAGSGLYQVRSVVSGLVLDLTDGGLGDGTPIQQWPAASDDPNQRWSLQSAR